MLPAYIVGDAVPQGHVVYQNMVVPVSIYNALQLGENPQAVVEPEPQRYRNFKLPTFARKEDDNLQNQLKMLSINSICMTFLKDTVKKKVLIFRRTGPSLVSQLDEYH